MLAGQTFGRSSLILTAGDNAPRSWRSRMFEHYLAALFGLRQMQDLAYSALPDAPVLPDRGDRGAKRDRRSGEPASPGSTAEAADGSSKRDLCPCRQRGPPATTAMAGVHGRSKSLSSSTRAGRVGGGVRLAVPRVIGSWIR